MKLFLIRHAQAGQHGDPRYPDDRLRPLTDEGRRRFTCVVKALAGRGFEPDIVATSPLVRCRQTAEIVAERIHGKPKVVELEALEPGGNLHDLIRWTNEQGVDSVAWVGHAPDVGLIATALLGAEVNVRFAKGAVGAFNFSGSVEPGSAELCWFVTAKVLDC